MPLLKRKTVILAKIEGGSYGIDPVPTGAANAILIRNGSITPQDGESADRALVRPYLGNSPKLPGAIRGVLQFEVELAGAGTAGTAPAWGPLVRGCAYAETLLGTLATGTATGGSVSTITLAGGASAVDQAYKGMRIDITGGAGSGQYATIRDYVGATKVATFCETLAVALTATSVYSIGAQAAYAPVSASFESLTFYFNVDGVLHKMTGARGTVAATASAVEVCPRGCSLPRPGRPRWR
jgi:hypothetical protein